jgi:Tyrosine phosphatase family
LKTIPISSHKHYLNSSTREITPSSFTATKANTDGSTTYLSELTSSGVVVGCLRKLQGWSLASIFNEYDRYAQGKGESDLQVPSPADDVVLTVKFIENFDKKIDFDTQHKPAWMP